jgi:hypothetical protein
MNPYAVAGFRTNTVDEHDMSRHMKLYDDMVRENELINLKGKIQTAIDQHVEWGQFEAWWNNANRTHTIVAPKVVREKHTSFRRTPSTYRHNDDFLIALLRDAQERRDYAQKQKSRNIEPSEYYVDDTSGTNVDVAWRSLCMFFGGERENERWHRKNWQPSDAFGPHRP